jgi:hypothetical protein
MPPNKSLLRAGGRWHLECNEVVVMDKLPMTSLGEPPGAELSRWATLLLDGRQHPLSRILHAPQG